MKFVWFLQCFGLFGDGLGLVFCFSPMFDGLMVVDTCLDTCYVGPWFWLWLMLSECLKMF